MKVGEVFLTECLRPGNEERAREVLAYYFKPMSEHGGFTGGLWDTFDPSGTRLGTEQEFTADDLSACSLLSAPIEGPAVHRLLLSDERFDHQSLLARIPTDVDFVDLDPESDAWEAMSELYRRLRGVPGLGRTRVSKLMARKRPRLVPIIDSIVAWHAFRDSLYQWRPLQDALRANDRALQRRLVELKESAALPEAVSPLRIFDVLTWMDGTDQSRLAPGINGPDGLGAGASRR